MQIKPENLRNELKARQLPIYMICGEEPLQHKEAVDMLRKAAKYFGYDEREVYTADNQFDWNLLSSISAELSLFASKRLIEIHLPTGKPSDKGEALIDYCAHLPPDVLLLIVAGKIEGPTRKAKWYKALDNVAGIVSVWPIEGGQLNHWLQRRLAAKHLTVPNEALQLINDRIEGNLLAADQEIEKLSLLYSEAEKTVNLDIQQVSDAVFDSARYNLFDLFDCAMTGDVKRAVKMLSALESEGQSIILILSLVAKEVRMLAKMSMRLQTQDLNSAMQGYYIFPKRKPLIVTALKNHSYRHWQELLQQLLLVDKMAKGYETGDPWQQMQLLLARIAGQAFLMDGQPH